MKKIFDHLKQFLSLLEHCDLNSERFASIEPLTGIGLAMDSHIKRQKLVFNFRLTISTRQLIKYHQAILLSTSYLPLVEFMHEMYHNC